jgi:hypothetical protein
MEAPDSSVRGESRKNPRLKADLEVSLTTDISILNHRLDYTDDPHTLNLLGHTDNMSEAGLAFIVPSFQVDEEFCRDTEKTLRIGLALPTAPVTLKASPVHCEPLDRNDLGQGYRLGVRIMHMNADDEEQYLKYLRLTRPSE